MRILITCVNVPIINIEKLTVVEEVKWLVRDDDMKARPSWIGKQFLNFLKTSFFFTKNLESTGNYKRDCVTMFNWNKKNTRKTTSKLFFKNISN